MEKLLTLYLFFIVLALSTRAAIISSSGDRATIPGWRLQSEKEAVGNVTELSTPGAPVSSWYRIGPRATVMGGLIQAGVYNESTLFFSDNLQTSIDYSAFDTPWFYREEFDLEPQNRQHYFLQTHGISSRADIYLNGQLVVSKDNQVGAYGGQKYEITKFVKKGPNCLLIRAHQTDYSRDFGVGFIDWNPYPPDNGTGVWRNVEVLQTGPVAASPPRIVTDFRKPGVKKVKATVKLDLQNYEPEKMQGEVVGTINEDGNGKKFVLSQPFDLNPNEKKTLSISVDINNPQIWWPARWGKQPLYSVKLEIKVGNQISDSAGETRFGIRHVTSHVDPKGVLRFQINGHNFFVQGAGYSSDMFLRFDAHKAETQFKYILDMGLNTVRLEGKQEHPEFYDIADRLGIMVMAGWECCDKWEGWHHNNEGTGEIWRDHDYQIAKNAMIHETTMMQSHPSMLAFLVGSDFWPDNKATELYVDAMNRLDWPNPIICSASSRGFPDLLGPSGMRMYGPYDWEPPNYWSENHLGSAYGFGSELGPGVGTPELKSLKTFLSDDDLKDLWSTDKNLFHMSKEGSVFVHRMIYNKALRARYGRPKNLDDYLFKAQIMDYEAARSVFEIYGRHRGTYRETSGLIYWMLNSAWPSLHWQLFDFYLRKSAAYYGTRTGNRVEHLVYDHQNDSIYLINHSVEARGERTILYDLIEMDGKPIAHGEVHRITSPNQTDLVTQAYGRRRIKKVGFIRLLLKNESGEVLSRNVYWTARAGDTLDWRKSLWYYTPVKTYADFNDLQKLAQTDIKAEFHPSEGRVLLENMGDVPAFFIRMTLLNRRTREEIDEVHWSDNFVTLWPKENLEISVQYDSNGQDADLTLKGYNLRTTFLQSR